MAADLKSFAASANGDLEIVTEPPCDLLVVIAEPKAPCTGDELKVDGRITCAVAWALGRKHGIPMMTLGALFNELHIKVRECSLGCFK